MNQSNCFAVSLFRWCGKHKIKQTLKVSLLLHLLHLLHHASVRHPSNLHLRHLLFKVPFSLFFCMGRPTKKSILKQKKHSSLTTEDEFVIAAKEAKAMAGYSELSFVKLLQSLSMDDLNNMKNRPSSQTRWKQLLSIRQQ